MLHYLLFLTLLGSINCIAQDVYLNEIRANDASTDDAEFIELVGPAGTDITGWSVIHVNGSGGAVVFEYTFPENTIIPDDSISDISGNTIGFIVVKNSNHSVPNADFDWGPVGLQNGPDGLILQDPLGNRIQALTWNGSGDLTGGNPPWRDVGSDANDDRSLSAPDNVTESAALPWSLAEATPGGLNTTQGNGDISLPVELTSFTAKPGDGKITLKWITAAEVDNLGFILERCGSAAGDYDEIASYENCAELKGRGNSSETTSYSYTDLSVFNDLVYWYRLSDVDVNGLITTYPPISAIPNAAAIKIRSVAQENYPDEYELLQNYPNPFNPQTKIGFSLPEEDYVTLAVYDITGKKICLLFKGNLSPGHYELQWPGTDQAGNTVTAGVYFYTFNSVNYFNSRKMVLLQ